MGRCWRTFRAAKEIPAGSGRLLQLVGVLDLARVGARRWSRDDARLPQQPGDRLRRLRPHGKPVPAATRAGRRSRRAADLPPPHPPPTHTLPHHHTHKSSRGRQGAGRGGAARRWTAHFIRSMFKPRCLLPSWAARTGSERVPERPTGDRGRRRRQGRLGHDSPGAGSYQPSCSRCRPSRGHRASAANIR